MVKHSMLFARYVFATKLTVDEIMSRSRRFPKVNFSNTLNIRQICFDCKGARLTIAKGAYNNGAVFYGRIDQIGNERIISGGFYTATKASLFVATFFLLLLLVIGGLSFLVIGILWCAMLACLFAFVEAKVRTRHAQDVIAFIERELEATLCE